MNYDVRLKKLHKFYCPHCYNTFYSDSCSHDDLGFCVTCKECGGSFDINIDKYMIAEKKCDRCEYKENCELLLYMVAPCECETKIIVPNDVLEPIQYKYQNALTGKFDDKPLEPYYLYNPFAWDYYNN